MKVKLGPKKERDFPPGWSRLVIVDGQGFKVGIRSMGRVKLMYRPRGSYGHVWEGYVYAVRCLFSGDVRGSIGARGLLKLAGVMEEGR